MHAERCSLPPAIRDATHASLPLQMEQPKKIEEEAKVHRIRITLTSCSVKDLEKGASNEYLPSLVRHGLC
jgi:hypothetical protein